MLRLLRIAALACCFQWLLPARAATVTVVDVIPASASFETWQDSEPSIAINPKHPEQMAISALTQNYASPTSALAPIFVSSDSGQTWMANAVLPGGSWTADVTLAFATASNDLYAAVIRRDDYAMELLRTPDATSPRPMIRVLERGCPLEKRPSNCPDQPYVYAMALQGQLATDQVLVASNNLVSAPKSAYLDWSTEAGSLALESRIPDWQDGPPVRIAISSQGRVYAAFFHWKEVTQYADPTLIGIVGDVIVEGGSAPLTADDVLGAISGDDGRPGIAAAPARAFQASSAPSMGGQRVGNFLSLVLDPRANMSMRLYIAWTDGNAESPMLHVQRSDTAGAMWSPDLIEIPNAINPALAVNEAGTVGLLYQQYDAANLEWTTSVLTSRDGTFAHATRYRLSVAPTPPATDLAFQPLLGDYDNLQTIGNDFVGAFSANNLPLKRDFPDANVLHYQRYADWSKGELYSAPPNARVRPTVSTSIDPFFFRIHY